MTYITSNLNPDFNLGFYSFREFPISLTHLFDHELSGYQRRFKVAEKDDGYQLTLELPGFKAGDLDVQLEKGVLSVRAKNERDEVESSITVGEDIDPNKVDAIIENGLLTIKLQKKESSKPRKVVVK